jgi:hypothetical protein
MVAPARVTLREAATQFLTGAKASPPTVLNRSGEPFEPSALRGYEADLKRYVLDELGGSKRSEIRRADLQRLADELTGRASPARRSATS